MAVDALGRYQLVDLRDRVRRVLDSYQIVVSTSGVETSTLVQDQAISNTDINNQLNEAIVEIYAELIAAHGALFASTTYYSVKANNPGPYALDPTVVQIRWMRWKDPSVSFNPSATPSSPSPKQWHPMEMIEDPNDWDLQEGVYHAPTWRWEQAQFYLNEVPQMDNLSGIQASVVSFPAELVNDTDYISIPKFVRITQQVAIYEAARTLAITKRKQMSAEFSQKVDKLHTLMGVLVANAYNTLSTRVGDVTNLPQATYTGRRHRIA